MAGVRTRLANACVGSAATRTATFMKSREQCDHSAGRDLSLVTGGIVAWYYAQNPGSHIGSSVGVYNVRTLVCWAADVNRERCESPRAKGRACLGTVTRKEPEVQACAGKWR